ncbi:hypothetical protein QKU48_gp0663 [Fadolivirus algeromassiliense]|jgi:hypothetical protein|uniref:Uncharacterized protein n=1 Tax=Fadolivirus FV1/VV64 TaxID=3070911 RepID=A0A7D3R119_9VIRU|nr:hypothetical protein QKU48_gp0663 [Fadolivirus algeromassiliense]QKF94121.1 hypothetical protein Fadolivirus_1_663 [Fadolivirus FV1/VV64]
MNINPLDTPPGPNSAKLYTNCNTVPLVNTPVPSNGFIVGIGVLKQNDLSNDANLRKGIMAVKAGPKTLVKLFDNPNATGMPFMQVNENDTLRCLTQAESLKIKSIAVAKVEGFGMPTTVCGYTLYEIVMVLVLLFLAYLVYRRYTTGGF